MVKDILVGISGSRPENLTVVGNTFFFSADNGINGTELWKSNGTAEGTVMVKDIWSGLDQWGSPANSWPRNLTVFNNALYFTAYDGTNGTELWKSNGTAEGTVMVKDIYLGPNGSWPNNLTVFNNALYFAADDGTNGEELWKSDGTEEGTVMVKDIWSGLDQWGSPASSWPYNLTVFNNALYFTAYDGTNGTELWKSNGTEEGTVMVKDIYLGPNGSWPNNLTVFNNALYFAADDGANGEELWKSNGTEEGTVMVKDIRPGLDGGSPANSWPRNLTVFNNALYFAADDGANGEELWKSNGTEEGTVMVKDIYLGPNGSWPNNLTVFNNALYFAADDGTNGEELWKSDGTEEGTVMVKDIRPGLDGGSPAGSWPRNLTVFNNVLYFAADDGANGEELWKSNGTEEGTVMVKDIWSGLDQWGSINSSSPQNLTVVGNTLYFSANDGISGRELWALDAPIIPETPPTPETPDTTPPVFTNFPGSTDGINITEDQFITTNPYTIKVKPEDESGIQKVEFYVDNNLLCTDTTADPNGIYSCDWDTAKFNSTVRVVAFDNTTNTSQLTRNTTVDPRLYLRILPRAGRG